MERAVDELAARLGVDEAAVVKHKRVRPGQVMPSYVGEVMTSCTRFQCLERVKEMIGWEEKYPGRTRPNGHIWGVGLAMAMQGSAISGIDVGGATLKVGDEGMVNLLISLGLADEDFVNERTEGFRIMQAQVEEFTAAYVARTCGISVQDLASAVKTYGTARTAALLYCPGVPAPPTGHHRDLPPSHTALVTGHPDQPRRAVDSPGL